MSFTSSFSEFNARLRQFMAASRPCCATSGGRAALQPNSQAAEKALSHDFEELAWELFALQFEHNLPYRRLCEARRLSPQALSHWNQIPTVPTSAFKDLELSCLPPARRTAVFHSSGTTEQRPSRHFHAVESLAVYESSLLRWFETHLLPEGHPPKRLLVLTPPPAQAPHSSLVHMFESIRRTYPWTEAIFLESVGADGAWDLNWAAALHALQQSVETAQRVVLLGTAFSFVHLLDQMAEQNQRIKLPSGSRVLETGGYKGRSRSLPKAELHALITARLGIPATHILCEYGMSELSSQAYDRVVNEAGNTPAARLFRFPPWARTQIVSTETGREVAEGETGLIRVFDLANVYSVMAVQTEDLAIRRGNGFELIGRAVMAEPRGCSLMAG